MPRLADVMSALEQLAPRRLAEEWDNVGLLLGNPDAEAARVLTCLTLTADVADEAIHGRADLIVSHHPILFRPVKSLRTTDPQGAMLLRLIVAGVSVYSPHTSYDSAAGGINQQLAERFGLQAIRPLRPTLENPQEGAGRWGVLAEARTVTEFCTLIKHELNVAGVHVVGDPHRPVRTVAVACGAAAEFMKEAAAYGCDLFLTGEARFHDALRARELGITLVLPGHYATERHGAERLATLIAAEFPTLTVWPSAVEHDPLQWC